MSRSNIAVIRAATLALLCAAGAARADEFDVGWWTTAGGGDMWTTGESYELSGTIGQPDAGVAMTGAAFELTSGFWGVTIAAPMTCIGDMNCDGTYGYLSFGDINPFVLYLSNFSAWRSTYPGCAAENGDIDTDGTYGQGSFGDINPFVTLLSSQPLPIACP